ncbi:alpha-N-arabinofuranosidase [Bacteroidota bacterium]
MKIFKFIIIQVIALFMIISCTMHDENEVAENTIVIKVQEGKDTISRHIYGHFAEHLGRCIYDGFWVGLNSPIPNTRGIRNDVAEAFREIAIPNLRWPGGCFADAYHWRDGIGDPKSRGNTVNMSWGGYIEDNSFGTHEFMDLCEQLNCEPVICGNIGSGTVEEMAEWIEYLTSNKETPLAKLRKKNGREEPWNIKYWGVGNETWGCGGIMTAEFYSSQLKKYSVFLKHYGGGQLYKVAVGPYGDNTEWTEILMKDWSKTDGWLKHYMSGLSLHYYTICNDWGEKGSAINFDESEWFASMSKTIDMDNIIKTNAEVMEKYDPENNVGLVVDEWGNWFDPEENENPSVLYQQNTLRDALVAGLNLNIFNNNCRRVKMANIAQAVNVLQSMILTKDEKMVKTPSFYVFKLYKVHHDALLLPIESNSEKYDFGDERMPALSASASKNNKGEINITITNVNPNKEIESTLSFDGIESFNIINAEIITADEMNDLNDFDKEEKVNIQPFETYDQDGNNIVVNMPPKSIVLVTIKELADIVE